MNAEYINKLLSIVLGDCPGGPVVKTPRFHCRGRRFSIPDWGTKIPRAMRLSAPRTQPEPPKKEFFYPLFLKHEKPCNYQTEENISGILLK